MESRLERLRGLYESFFMVVERPPPNAPRRELKRLITESQQIIICKAPLRFRLQTVMQRWVLYTAYWNRTMREIEAGTYRRDLAKAQRHLGDRGGAITEEEALALGIPANRARAFVDRQQRMLAARKEKADGAAAEPSPSEPEAGAENLKLTGGSGGYQAATASAMRAALASGGGDDIPGVNRRDFDKTYERYLETHRKS